MIKIYKYGEVSNEEIFFRGNIAGGVEGVVSEIIANVIKNKDKALRILRARLFDEEQRKHDEAIASDRKNQVGTGDRSERIRTYNYPQGRVTDHRIGLTLYKLDQILNGDIDEIVDGLITYYRTEALKSEEEN